jgi:hypothetical protein
MHASPKRFVRTFVPRHEQAKETPFRIKLRGGAEVCHHLARDAVDAHADHCAPSLSAD